MGNLISSYSHVEVMYLVLTWILKGIVHPKIRIKHNVFYVDGEVGEIFEPAKQKP